MPAKIKEASASKEKPPKYVVKDFNFSEKKSKNAYCKVMGGIADGTVEIVGKHVTTMQNGNVVIWLEYWLHAPDLWIDDPDI
jgi:hypothetical protein